MNIYTIIFIGRSGCGKGTQADLLRDYISEKDYQKRPILYIETGDKFREFVRLNNFSSSLSKSVYDRDDRQPDFLACLMWGNVMVEELNDNMHLVVDGSPRSLTEAVLMTTAFEFYKREKPTVIHLKVSRRWSEDRLLSRGRSDDRGLVKINKRLDWFDKDVVPAINYYKGNPDYSFLEINGEQTIEKVFEEIITKLQHDKA